MNKNWLRVACGVTLGFCVATACACENTEVRTSTSPRETSVTAVDTGRSTTLGSNETSTTDRVALEDEDGSSAVLAFLQALADQDFDKAASLYGGELYAPGTERADQLAAAVRLRVVLPGRLVRIEPQGWLQVVWVQLMQPDGTPYTHVPPQDAPGEPTDEFAFHVVRVNGTWWVMDLPPYEE